MEIRSTVKLRNLEFKKFEGLPGCGRFRMAPNCLSSLPRRQVSLPKGGTMSVPRLPKIYEFEYADKARKPHDSYRFMTETYRNELRETNR
jgi:hypothetical protein